MLGIEWKKQEYILGYQARPIANFDIGLNYQVGTKWPRKAMPMAKWKNLAKQLEKAGYTVSWQQGLADLEQYIDWLDSCRVIITHDSLGLHLGLALRKKIIGLFGPTDPQEIYFYHDSQVIMSTEKCNAMPCYTTNKCITGKECMNKIDVSQILETVYAIYPKEELKYAIG
jgi:heptosyltransferase-2